MFTLAQIENVHHRFGRPETLIDYLRALASIGVVRCDSFVSDGRSEFIAVDGSSVVSPPNHEPLAISNTSDRNACVEHLRLHGIGATSYVQMSAGLANSGVERWSMDTAALTTSYVNRSGEAIVVETLSSDE